LVRQLNVSSIDPWGNSGVWVETIEFGLNLLSILLMKRIALLFVLVMGLAAASAARSQQPGNASPAKPSGKAAVDTVDFKPSPELQKSLEELAAALQSLAMRIASDPQVKSAAMQVASGAVTTAQQVIAEQSVHIQEVLKAASDRISASQSEQHSKSRAP
jgi:hypothetical protein